jgi:hypothetical protein
MSINLSEYKHLNLAMNAQSMHKVVQIRFLWAIPFLWCLNLVVNQSVMDTVCLAVVVASYL